MVKYRILTIEELQELRNEFIEFLIINGISAEDWETILIEDKVASVKIIELFSDLIFEEILSKIKFLEKRSTRFVHVYKCLKDEVVLVGLNAEGNEEIDFTNPEILSSYMLTPPEGLKIFTSSKKYIIQREIEIFNMLEEGCLVSNDKLFKALCLSL